MTVRTLAACISAFSLCTVAGAQQTIIAQWNFNNNALSDLTPPPSVGSGSASFFGGAGPNTPSGYATGGTGGQAPTASSDLSFPNTAWNTTIYAPQATDSGQRGVEFAVSTLGFTGITLTYDMRHSTTASRFIRAFYSVDNGVTWVPSTIWEHQGNGDAWDNGRLLDLSSVAAVNNRPSLRIRIAPVFNPNAWTMQATPFTAFGPNAAYTPARLTSTYGTGGLGGGTLRYDMVTIAGTAVTATPIGVPQASASPAAACNTGSPITLAATVTPGQNPESSGLVVTANLSPIGGPASAPLAPLGNGEWTLATSVAPGTAVGPKSIIISAVDAQGRTASGTATLTVADCATASTAPVVISQVYGGGGNTDAPINADFVELFNRSANPVSLEGWSVQYASPTSAGGFANASDRVILSGVLSPGQFALVRFSDAGTVGSPLPPADFATATGLGGLGNTGGRVALARTTALLGAACTSADVVDLVGYGNAICFEGAGSTAAPSNTVGVVRKQSGLQDTNQNFNDFLLAAPAPRNRASGGAIAVYPIAQTIPPCDGSPVEIASTVIPSAGASSVTVTANLTAIGGPAAAPLSNNGSAFTAAFTLPVGLPAGEKLIPITATDNLGRTDTRTLSLLTASCRPTATPVVISAFFGGGGNANALWNADYVELFNRSQTPVDVTGWSLQYASAAGAGGFAAQVNLSPLGVIPAGGYRLIRMGAVGGGGLPLPDADLVATPAISLDNQFGRLALVRTLTGLGQSCTASEIVDLVGYGASAACFEGVAPTENLSNLLAAERRNGGCQDTNNSAVDFLVAPPGLPRNASTPLNLCPPVIIACNLADVTGIGGPPSGPDGLLTGDDFNAFIGAFAAGEALADLTGIGGPPAGPDGLITGDDFNAFIAAFASGCP
ncbi:MAG: lamin tail domain-containing protein [Phycisphaerales bacterium]|jgi:hypothetical protein|nr:lamin tail domain-containing protein [Phycisphaerales bacterium]